MRSIYVESTLYDSDASAPKDLRPLVHGLLTKTKPTAGVDTVTTSRGAA